MLEILTLALGATACSSNLWKVDPRQSDKDSAYHNGHSVFDSKVQELAPFGVSPGNAGGYGIFFEKKYHSLVMESRRVKGLDTKTWVDWSSFQSGKRDWAWLTMFEKEKSSGEAAFSVVFL